MVWSKAKSHPCKLTASFNFEHPLQSSPCQTSSQKYGFSLWAPGKSLCVLQFTGALNLVSDITRSVEFYVSQTGCVSWRGGKPSRWRWSSVQQLGIWWRLWRKKNQEPSKKSFWWKERWRSEEGVRSKKESNDKHRLPLVWLFLVGGRWKKRRKGGQTQMLPYCSWRSRHSNICSVFV